MTKPNSIKTDRELLQMAFDAMDSVNLYDSNNGQYDGCFDLEVKLLRARLERLECKFVGLTDEDMSENRTHNFDFIHGARWAEVKLKEKNT
jgi:hypothetical protein